MYYLRKTASIAMPSHHQNLELFQLLDTAQCRINELAANPEVHTGELKHWENTAEKAREQLILANQGLVASIAKKYENLGVDTEDLISEGTIGLAKAIAKFDYRLGNQFATFSYYSIRGAITRALSTQARTIRIPEERLAEIRKVKDVVERLREDCAGDPTAEDVAWAMNLPERKVRALLTWSQQTDSMDSQQGDADSASCYDLIQDASSVDPAQVADRASMLELVDEAVATLVGLEREIFLMFKDGPRLSLGEIGKDFSLSGERIRQIQSSAMRKVRAFVKAKDRKGPAQALKAFAAKTRKLQPAPAADEKTSSPVGTPKVYRLKMRAVEKNPNHHITNNNGTWYCKFTLELAAGGKTEVRNSLHTHNVEDARKRRDKFILLYKVLSGVSAA